jgi:hypothetical protein
VTARAQLDDYLSGLGFSAVYAETEVDTADGPLTFVQLTEIVSDADSAVKLRFETDEVTVTIDDTDYQDLRGIRLLTAEAFSVALQAGYADNVGTVSERDYSTVGIQGEVPRLFYTEIDEVSVALSDGAGSSLIMASTLHDGITRVQAGEAGSRFEIKATGGLTYLDGSAAADSFDISDGGQVNGIGGELFLSGGGGEDTVTVDASDQGAVEVDMIGETWQRVQQTEERLRLANALEVGALSDEDEQAVADGLVEVAVRYARSALNPPLRNDAGGFDSLELARADYLRVLEAVAADIAAGFTADLSALTAVIDAEAQTLIDDDVTALSQALSKALADIEDGLAAIANARAGISAEENRVNSFTNLRPPPNNDPAEDRAEGVLSAAGDGQGGGRGV